MQRTSQIVLILVMLSFSSMSLAEGQARIVTSEGAITIKFFNDAPQTVAHFIGLASGSTKYTDTKGRKVTGKPFYNGLIVHRAHPRLGVATGCPLGTGHGWAGKTWNNELRNELSFNKPGIVAMASAPGEKSHSSQFFITTQASPHLNGKHSIFAIVTAGMDVVRKIANTPTDSMMKPKKVVKIQEVKIL